MEETPAFENDEGARPSSLIAVHKLTRSDPLHDLQLLRDVAIINERTEREFGRRPAVAVEAPVKRKPRIARIDACNNNLSIDKENEMKITPLIAALALSAGASTASSRHFTDSERPENSTDSTSSEHPAEKLGPEYKNVSSFVEFRQKLLKDGWVPVPNPDCMEETVGPDYRDFCGTKEPKLTGCELCSLAPEIFRYTMDGYILMRYKKGDTVLGVSLYGDSRALKHPADYDLAITGWHYDGSIYIFPIKGNYKSFFDRN